MAAKKNSSQEPPVLKIVDWKEAKVPASAKADPARRKMGADLHAALTTFRNIEALAGKSAMQPLRLNVLKLILIVQEVMADVLNSAQSERLAAALLNLDALESKPQGPEIDSERILKELAEIKAMLDAKPAVETEWVTVDQFRKMVHKSKWTINNNCRLGLIRCRKNDNGPKAQWRILKSEAKRVIEEGFKEQVQEPYDPKNN